MAIKPLICTANLGAESPYDGLAEGIIRRTVEDGGIPEFINGCAFARPSTISPVPYFTLW
jgi:hypothetical protein